MAQLTELIRRRGLLKSALTRFETFLNNASESTIKQIPYRVRDIKVTWESFNTIQMQIEELQADDDNDERLLFEEKYYTLLALSDEIIIQEPTADLNKTISEVTIKLPLISLPKFAGNYNKFIEFKDTFLSLVHNNKSLSNIQKFHYLKSCLVDNAANILDSLPVSDCNYAIAWDLLNDRYDNKRIIINSHIAEILNIKSIMENSTSLRYAIDVINKNVRSLDNMNVRVEYWDAILDYIISHKMCNELRLSWESTLGRNDLPTVKELVLYLTNRCETLESVHGSTRQTPRTNNYSLRSHPVQTKYLRNCAICDSPEHYTYKCIQLHGNYQSKIQTLNNHNLCHNCLRKGHTLNECKSRLCTVCNQKHNTILHQDNVITNSLNVKTSVQSIGSVILATAVVQILDIKGAVHSARALLDSGSQCSIISEHLVNTLGLPKESSNISVSGIGAGHVRVLHNTKAFIMSRTSDFKTKMNFIVLPTITTELQKINLQQTFNIPKDIILADPEYHNGGSIDILLGAEIFFELLTNNHIHRKNQPSLQETVFGWIISGTYNTQNANNCINSHVRVYSCTSLNEEVRRFWNIEEWSSSTRKYTAEEQLCENHFKNNYQRTTDGRFVVALPLKEHNNTLGESRRTATKRFMNLQQQFIRNTYFKLQYNNFMTEYENLNHMNRISNEVNNQTSYYIPHHAVMNNDSPTTKLRVVFDASSKTTNGISLNDVLMVGPTIQSDLISIIMRFRMHEYVFTSDIVKMYRQILVKPEHRNYQRILWTDGNSEPQEYVLNMVTYGTASAPFLAIRCLHQLALDEMQNFPEAAAIMLNSFYVDDLLTGAQSLTAALQLRDDITTILTKGGFTLSNTKTLGIRWNPTEDTFHYEIKIENEISPTKRSVLSQIARIYDPLGLVGPIVLKAKSIMQELWKINISWDDKLPEELTIKWEEFRTHLKAINDIRIPRKISLQNASTFELHGFCDASETGYGASLYIKTTTQSTAVVKLICSKSRVAPLKSLSIPRLELCGAHLLAKLMKRVTEALSRKFENIYCWTDSTIVIAWLSSPSYNWKTFVANRVSEIQDMTANCEWNHVPSEDNPTDCLSRGLHAHELTHNSLWWNGPSWLSADRESWPSRHQSDTMETLEQRAKKPVMVSMATVEATLWERYSTFTKLIRVVAYCLRFTQNCKHRTNKISGPLSSAEYNSALHLIIRQVQHEEFLNDINNLQTHKTVKTKSSILSLHPFLDENKIIRVGGRLQASTRLTFGQKHPILLPNHHMFTRLIILHYHVNQLHAGPEATLAAIRTRYWPISARSQIRQTIRRCITCFKARPTEITPLMGNLPAPRICPSKPFTHTGVDYAGPFLLREGRTRGRKIVKAYLALFVCFTTKAIHLEIVSDLTTEAFISALRRFMCRRGKCQHFYSDNATCFTGADKELKELFRLFNAQPHQTTLQDTFYTDNITWHFAPPRAPHFNGLAEAGIKSAKYHLKRIAGKAPMTFEELSTLFVQVEACLNSRPLIPLSSNSSEFSILTPAHFLIGDTFASVPEPDLTELKLTHLSRWQRVQQMTQHFWSRWSADYLHNLNQRTKWKTDQPETIKPGTMVLIREDHLSPLQWSLGRVLEVHCGKDGIARVASVKTIKGIFKRAFVKLSALPFEQ